MSFSRYFLTIWGLCLFGLSAEAATLKGTVRDAYTSEPLPGAAIVLVGTNRGVSTGPDGAFLFEDLPAGELQFEVSFMGYQSERIKQLFRSNSIYTREVLLKPQTEEMSEVQVYGRAVGQMKAFTKQEQAENIVNIVSREQIVSFPDLNAADALQRVTGVTLQRDQGEGRYVQLRGTPPEFTNFNVNGIQLPSPEGEIRTVGMDIINASQIETIEVSKVLTPDMNADAIGGTVNLVTKKAESSEPKFYALLAGGFNNLRQTPNAEMQFTFSQRKGRLGFFVNANYNVTRQGADNIEFDYEKGVFFGDTGQDNYHVQYTEVQLRHYDLTRQRIGVNATLDYYLNENNLIYVSGMFNRFTDDEVRRRKVFTLDDALSERAYLFGGIEHDMRDRIKVQDITNLNFGGEHKLPWAEITYEMAWSQATETQPNYLEVVFENPGQAIFIRWDDSDPEYPKPTYPDLTNSENATDWENFDMDQMLLEQHESIDQNIIGRVDIKIPYGSGLGQRYFKFGSLLRTKDKSRDVNAQSFGAYRENSSIYPLPGDPLNLVTISDGFRDDNLLDQGYVLEYMPSPGLMRDFYERWPNLFIYGDAGVTETRERSFGQDYTAREDVQAYYGMLRHDFGKLMVLTGLRYERTDIDYEGFLIYKTSSGFLDTGAGSLRGMDRLRAKRVQDFWLPNLQFKYSINDRFNLRAAWTYSYARPNFRDVIPYRVQSERTEIRFGNPELDYPFATNVDLLLEKYWGPRSMVSGGVFYKNIENFIFNYQIFGYEGDPRESNFNKVQLELPLNGRQANVRGLELQSQFMMRFLPRWWSNFGFFGNYTFTQSEAQINKRFPANQVSNIFSLGGDYEQFFQEGEAETIPLPGQSPHALNLALFYDTQKFFLKVAANYNDQFLVGLGVDPDLDEYYAAQWRVDINGYYQINETVQVFADIRNVTNQPLRFFLGDPSQGRTLQQEFYSFWARIGVRLQF